MLNQVTLVGRTCGDIEIKTFESRNKVGELTLAISEKRKDREGNYVDHSEFIRCRMWGKTAELVESYVSKGSMVGFVGKFVTDQWEKDGVKHFKSYVAVRELKFIPGGRPENQNNNNAGFQNKPLDTNAQPQGGGDAFSDIPFL